MVRSKARGSIGSWFADVDGERLACVHRHWIKGTLHNDPEAVPKDPKWVELISAIKETRKVVVTRDEVRSENGLSVFKRQGYEAVYRVGEIGVGAKSFRFRLVERLRELE